MINMRFLRQRLSALDVFLLVILVISTLSSSLAVYRDKQVYDRFYEASSGDDHFTISGSPVSRAMLPIRLVLMTLLLISFIGVRSRKFGGKMLSALGLLLLIGLYLQWWRHSFQVAKSFEYIESTKEMSHTLYLKDGNWLDIGVFLASIVALGCVVATFIAQLKDSKVKDSGKLKASRVIGPAR
jgi:hypothetical protein